MRLVRIAGIVIAIVVLFIVGVAIFAHVNQRRIVRYVLDQVQTRSGMTIAVTGSRIHLRAHLVVVLENPRVTYQGRHTSARALVAVISYDGLLGGRGLPLAALIVNRPRFELPPAAAPPPLSQLPRPNAALADRLGGLLASLSGVTRRVNVNRALLTSDKGATVAVLDLAAYHRRLEPGWQLSFDLTWKAPPLRDLKAAGSFKLDGILASLHGETDKRVAAGRVWFWQVPLAAFGHGIVGPGSIGAGALNFSLTQSGRIAATVDANAKQVRLGGGWFKSPIKLNDLSARAELDATDQAIALNQLTVAIDKIPALGGDVHIDAPYAADASLTAHVHTFPIRAATLKEIANALRGVPPAVVATLDHFRSGEIAIQQATLTAKRGTSSLARMLRDLSLQATLSGGVATLPASFDLRQVRNLSARATLDSGVLTISDVRGVSGKSTLSDLRARINLRGKSDALPYQVEAARAILEMGEVFPALRKGLSGRIPRMRRVKKISGRVKVELSGRGTFDFAKPALPASYEARIVPLDCRVSIDGLPSALTLMTGQAVVRPGEIRFQRLTASADHGTIVADGGWSYGGRAPAAHGLKIGIHQVDGGRWLPLVVDPKNLAIKGSLGGNLVIDGSISGSRPSVKGKLTMGSGTIQFGFLRSPIVVQTALLVMDGRGLVLTMPGATIEGSPVAFKITVADLSEPVMRIDTSVQHLDLEVMKFVRLPWEPPTPVFVFKVPVIGHLEADKAIIEKLAMTAMNTDFSYDHGDWHVFNFQATTLGGSANLDVLGREKDDWIHIVGSISGLGVGPLFMLKDAIRAPPLTGALFANADLWADTDNDFFQTLKGKTAFVIRNGRLNKFTLLTKLLSLIDLKNWLTASVPDPRVAGLPFDFLSADFAGNNGVFHTDDMRLDGPVMDILAQGDMNLATSELDMQVGVLPFNTVNWLVSKIPLIGQQVSQGSQGLVGAYLSVKGPYTDPRITPKPLTSIFELLKRTIGLPINLIRPHTVK